MTDTPHLGLPLLAAAQAQKHVTHNEALALLDGLVQLSVLERGRLSPPAAPAEGDRYLVGAPATGAFAGREGCVALFDAGAWRFLTPRAGWRLHVAAENAILVHDGAGWDPLSAYVGDLERVTRLGIGMAADPVNGLAAKLAAALLTAVPAGEGGSGDLRLVLNKEAAADVASQLFQTGFSGRAEIGLVGDDDLAMRVSADGAAWKERVRLRSTSVVLQGERADQGNTCKFHVGRAGNAIGVVVEVNAATGVKLADFGLQTDDHLITFRNEGRPVWCLSGAAPEFQVRFPPPFATSPLSIAPTLVIFNAPARLRAYTVAALPAAAGAGAGALVWVSDAAGGAAVAYSDGAAWRRMRDGTAV